MAGLSWSDRDARKEQDRKASEVLQKEIEKDWQAKLAAKENRRPVTFNDAEKALREEAAEVGWQAQPRRSRDEHAAAPIHVRRGAAVAGPAALARLGRPHVAAPRRGAAIGQLAHPFPPDRDCC